MGRFRAPSAVKELRSNHRLPTHALSAELSGDDAVAVLGLSLHPASGHFRNVFHDNVEPGITSGFGGGLL